MKWTVTSPNLERRDDGQYRMNFKHNRRHYRILLKTDVRSVAVARLANKIAEIRTAAGLAMRSRSTMAGIFAAFLEKSAANGELKPRTKDYHVETVELIKRRWPKIEEADAAKVGATEVKKFFDALRIEYSPTRFNGALQVLRACFSEAIALGVRFDNPCAGITHESVLTKIERVPSADEFERVLEALAKSPGESFHVVKFLAFSGARITEAGLLLWSDVDWVKARIHFRAEIAKNGKDRYVPFIGGMEELLREMQKLSTRKTILPIKSAQRALGNALKKLGIDHFSHHDLRHLFATRCIESGVDIPTVARWLGHQDGGALAMRVYGHLRDDHSREQARKVAF